VNNGFNSPTRFLFYEGVQTICQQEDTDWYYIGSWNASISYFHIFTSGINNGPTTIAKSTW
jgi:hypothetical protein